MWLGITPLVQFRSRSKVAVHVVHDSWDALILQERAIVLRAIGALLGVGGLVMIGSMLRVHGLSVEAPVIVGAIVGTLGALMAFLPATHTFAFSRSERRLVILRRRLGRTTREEYALRDVAQAYVEASNSSEGDTWRVVVQLADGQIVPVTSYYSSGYESKRRAADRIGEFLDRAGNRDSNDSAPSREAAPPRGLTPRQRRSAVTFITLFGLIFGGIGGLNMLREQRRLTTWLPVEATVLSKRVEEHSDSDGSTYSPVVVYRYYVNDRPYTSSRVLPVGESRSGGWAHRMVAQYDVHATYTAWYDPADPAAAYLSRSRSLVAPIFTALGVVLIVSAALVARGERRRNSQ